MSVLVIAFTLVSIAIICSYQMSLGFSSWIFLHKFLYHWWILFYAIIIIYLVAFKSVVLVLSWIMSLLQKLPIYNWSKIWQNINIRGREAITSYGSALYTFFGEQISLLVGCVCIDREKWKDFSFIVNFCRPRYSMLIGIDDNNYGNKNSENVSSINI